MDESDEKVRTFIIACLMVAVCIAGRIGYVFFYDQWDSQCGIERLEKELAPRIEAEKRNIDAKQSGKWTHEVKQGAQANR